MEIAADSGLRLAVFSAESGSRSAEALDLLASRAATDPSGDGWGDHAPENALIHAKPIQLESGFPSG